jgi:hypothetical protein
MIFDQACDPGPQLASDAEGLSVVRSEAIDMRQYLVLKRQGRWCIKIRGRFSAPFSSEAMAVRVAIDLAERVDKDGRPVAVTQFTRQSGFKTIRIVGHGTGGGVKIFSQT